MSPTPDHSGGDGRDAPPVPLWPVWEFDSGYAQLARYVTPRAIGLDLDLAPRLSRADEDGLAEPDLDRLRAERLYERLQGFEIAYEQDPWAAREGVQQVRHPWWLLSGRLGNCLDLALTYAGACLASGVGALLALAGDHAYVVLTPGRLAEEGARESLLELEGFGPARREDGEPDPGVLSGSERALAVAAGAGHVVVVDAVGVEREGCSFKEALGGLGSWPGPVGKPGGSVCLVDVAHLQTGEEFAELPHPTSFRPSIRLRVPSGGGEFREFGAHAEVIAGLRRRQGMHVLIGERGRGKSTIARHLAETARDGAAWFLDASDREALANSLALAMFAEEPRAREEILDAPERKAQWETAFAYLRDKKSPWLIVLDNADGDPATLRGLVPEPGPGQQLLVTTTNRNWRVMPGYTFHPLPEVEAADLGRFAATPIAELIEGRPLLLEAFERLADRSAWDGVTAPASVAGLADELRGPSVFWSLLRGGADFAETDLRVAALAAYMPANGQPVAVIEALVPGAGEAIERLVERGLLVRDANAGELRMHRLFGEVIRLDLESESPRLCDEIVLALAGDGAARASLDGKGDPETVARLDRRLTALDRGAAPAAELGLALHGVARLLELHGATRASGKTFTLAERHLADRRELLADCLQGRARTVNQHHTDDRVMLEEALDWAREAHRMLIEADASEARAARCYAMQGLLMKPLANFPVEGKSKLELQREAREVIEEANRRRQASPEISKAEKARSTFNLAGIRIPLAQSEPEQAATHLDVAHSVYEEVLGIRQELYGRMNHPHIAACQNGLGLVGYYRALLVPAPREQQTQWLRDATTHAAQALKEREILDGAVDFEEAPKSAALLAKIALARNASPVAALRDSEALLKQAKGELTRAGLVLEPVALPPSRTDLVAGIDAWARSDALRQLVEQFDAELPAAAELPELLRWLEELSAESWDFRKGERDDVTPPQLSLLTEKVVKAAAKSLGLVEGSSLRKDRYDQVLILGGMARGCLSRPRHAAKLIGDGELRAGAVTALGAFRDLGPKEVGLVETVEGVTLGNEFEAMEAGVRRAFDLGAPGGEDGEDSDVVGASWRVHEFSANSGLPVSVVAAPSTEPGARRANTPDTFAWFATELARLEPGQRLLIVTTDIYVPYQHADALRMLSLPYGVEVDAIGVVPGKVDRRLAHSFEPHNYLQEIRSAILSLRKLLAALEGGGGA